MTKGEVLINFLKETFPDLVEAVEDDGKHIIDPDDVSICNFISCFNNHCHACVIDKSGLNGDNDWAKQEFTSPIKTDNTKIAITSGGISW